MKLETKVEKSDRGWRASSYADIGPAEVHGDKGTRKLLIETYKTDRGLVTRASVSLHTAHSRIHVFALGAKGGDFSKLVMQSPTRATEKAVRHQHTSALEQAGALYAEALAFYAQEAA